jgi:hypothetical protein
VGIFWLLLIFLVKTHVLYIILYIYSDCTISSANTCQTLKLEILVGIFIFLNILLLCNIFPQKLISINDDLILLSPNSNCPLQLESNYHILFSKSLAAADTCRQVFKFSICVGLYPSWVSSKSSCKGLQNCSCLLELNVQILYNIFLQPLMLVV